MKIINGLVSVVITTYNCGKYIEMAINSILNQSHNNIELVIVDDGSTDETDKIINKYQDEKINFHKIDHQGIPFAINFAISKAKGELLLFKMQMIYLI